MVYCLDYSKTAHCRIISATTYLAKELRYLTKELHYLTKELRYHNKVNLKGTLLDMNDITTLRIQSMNIIIC